MSFSRNLVRLEISAAVAVQRSIGRILALGKKNTNIKIKILPRYFARQFLPAVRDMKPRAVSVERPETIWQFWDNPAGRKTPAIATASIKTIGRWRGNFDHKVLNFDNIGEYSDLPGVVFDRMRNGRMNFAHFADLLRLNLLKNHGGIWMDATNYMTAPVPQWITDRDFFVFLVGNLTHYPYSFMQNFFIRAKKGAFLCGAWYEMCIAYWTKEWKDIEYFQHQLLFKALVERNPIGRKLFAEMPHVSEDETLQFVGDKLFQKFDPDEWEKIRNTSFFQKVTYKDGPHHIADPAEYPGTYFSKLCGGLK
jgi:hypothetical protein